MEIYAAVQPLVPTREAYQMMYGEDDPEELSIMQLQDKEVAERIISVLRELYFMESNFDQPREGEGLSETIGTAEDLGELRRIAAAEHGKTPDDYQGGGVPVGFQFNHLINHADDEGYYLPVDFPQAFFVEEISIGSAVALLAEMDALESVLAAQFPGEVALALSTPDDEERVQLNGPVGVWHALRRLCRSAIELEMPIHLG
jgi:hypothetical protein